MKHKGSYLRTFDLDDKSYITVLEKCIMIFMDKLTLSEAHFTGTDLQKIAEGMHCMSFVVAPDIDKNEVRITITKILD